MKPNLLILFIILVLSSFVIPKTNISEDDKPLSRKDSLLVEKYIEQVIRSYALPEDSLLTTDSIYSGFENTLHVNEGIVTYSPDSSFKIITITAEHCGASCHPEYISWIHFNLKGNEKIEPCTVKNISNIYVLPNRKYLILHSWEDSRFREFNVSHIWFTDINRLMDLPINYKTEKNFSISGDNDFDTIQGIRYNEKQKVLNYNYIKRNEVVNIDSICQGRFKYTAYGRFVFDKETITVKE